MEKDMETNLSVILVLIPKRCSICEFSNVSQFSFQFWNDSQHINMMLLTTLSRCITILFSKFSGRVFKFVRNYQEKPLLSVVFSKNAHTTKYLRKTYSSGIQTKSWWQVAWVWCSVFSCCSEYFRLSIFISTQRCLSMRVNSNHLNVNILTARLREN